MLEDKDGSFLQTFIIISMLVCLMESNYRRPVCSPAICLSGLFTLLGRMIVHSILLILYIGFPYLARFVYWYIAVGDSRALDHPTINDFSDNVKDAMLN